MKLSQLTKIAADMVDRSESGDETAAPEFRAWLLANIGDVASLLGYGHSEDAEVTRYEIAKLTAVIESTEALGAAMVKACRDKRTVKAEKARRDASKDAEAEQAGQLVIATSYADVDGLHLDGPALVAFARASRLPLLALTWGADLPALVLHKRAVVALASVHAPSTWQVTVEPARDSQGILDGFRAVVRVGRMRMALGSRAWTSFVKPAYDIDPAARVAVHHWAAVDGNERIETCASVCAFADAQSCEPMPSSFADEGQEAGALASYDCAAE